MASRRLGALAGATLLIGAAAQGATAATVPVVFVDLAGVGRPALDAMASEVASLLGPRVRLSWRRVEPGEESESKRERLRVVLLGKRPCGGRDSESLLATVSPSLPGRNLWVCVPNVQLTADLPEAFDALVPAERHSLGTALGRVIVHEMVHLADPELRHGTHGLFTRSLDRRQLVGASIHLEPVARESLLRALGRWSDTDGEASPVPLASLR